MSAGDDSHAIGELTNKVQALSSGYQALQIDMQHVVKATDALKGMPLQQLELAHELSRLRETIDRTKADAQKGDDHLLIAINNLTTAIREDRMNSAGTARDVTRFKGAIWGLGIATGVIAVLGMGVSTLYATNTGDKFAALHSKVDASNKAREGADVEHKVRLDSLAGQVIELRLGQGQRDRERSQREEVP